MIEKNTIMNLPIVVVAVFLQIIYTRNSNANHISGDVDENKNNDLNDKYFIIVIKHDDLKVYDKSYEYLDKNEKKKYYLPYDENLKPVKRRFRDLNKDREERKQVELLQTQQERKVKEITDFMKDHKMTTNFLYDEVRRIKRQRIVKDDLRKMVAYLEKPGKNEMRAKILNCYQEARRTEDLSKDMSEMQTNNMVINVLKDPYNDGYIN